MKPLGERQLLICEYASVGLRPGQIATKVGLKNGQSVSNFLKTEAAQEQMAFLRDQIQADTKLEQEDVVKGFLEAIDLAKMQADPSSMINGWKEVGRMLGFYAPDKKKVELSGELEHKLAMLKSLPEDELLKLASGNVIEGDFVDVSQ